MTTIDNRIALCENYAEWLLEHQGGRELEQFFYDATLDQLTGYSDEELLDEIKNFCPELLENHGT